MERAEALKILAEKAISTKGNSEDEIAVFTAGLALVDDLLFQLGTIATSLERIAINLESYP